MIYDIHRCCTVGIEERNGEKSLVLTVECISITHTLSNWTASQAFEKLLPLAKLHNCDIQYLVTDASPELKTHDFISTALNMGLEFMLKE